MAEPASSVIEAIDRDRLGALPEGEPAERRQVLGAGNNREEMIAGERPALLPKWVAAVRDQHFRLADASRIEQDFAWQRIGRRVLRRQAHLEGRRAAPMSTRRSTARAADFP